jgi:hypothetical protein
MTEAEITRIKARSKDLRRRIESTLDKHGVQDPGLVNALGLTVTEWWAIAATELLLESVS